MASNKLSLRAGQRFGRYTVVAERPPRIYPCGDAKSQWLCRCDCGTERVIDGSSLSSGNSQSCGCLSVEMSADRARTHGLSKSSRAYRIWQAMLNRCRNPNAENFRIYGERGITVCERWLVFENFISDMGECPDGMSIERKNNNGNYEPSNCVWADRRAQSRNKRTNRVITFNGETKCLIDWADSLGMDQASLRERLEKWPLDKALTTPKRRAHGVSQ